MSVLLNQSILQPLITLLVMSWATSWDVLAAFAVTYSVPYLLGTPGANLGAKVGWIFAAISFASFIFALLFVPELQNRSLEETNELFERYELR